MPRGTSTTDQRDRLSRKRVLDAAAALADREGLDALSMRRLADEVGAGAMSLYHYVANKDDLIAGLVDRVFSQIALAPIGTDWKTAMRVRARSTREVLSRHPWAVGLMESRAVPGPQSLRVHDTVLGYLREAGFSIEATIQAYSVLDSYIYGFVLQDKTLQFKEPQDAAEVAKAQVREFEAGKDPQALLAEYPYLAQVVAGHVATVGYDPGKAFEDGLDLILDALEQLL